MKQNYKIIALTLGLICLANILQAQQETIKVWPKGPPGSLTDPTYNAETLYLDDGAARLLRVTDPALDIYLAPQDKASGAAVVICPGGGYGRLAVKKEGSDVAQWFNAHGISAFVLKYRLPHDKIMKDKSIGPLQDAQEAIRIVRRRAESWHIDSDKIGIMGFSAGGHLASTASTHFDEQVYKISDATSARPDFSILIYPVVSMDTTITHRGSHDNLLGKHPLADVVKRFSNELQVTGNTPPAFMIHAFDDSVVPVENSINYALAMKDHQVPVELMLYEKGGHGFGMAVNSSGTESGWTESCIKWLKTRGFCK